MGNKAGETDRIRKGKQRDKRCGIEGIQEIWGSKKWVAAGRLSRQYTAAGAIFHITEFGSSSICLIDGSSSNGQKL